MNSQTQQQKEILKGSLRDLPAQAKDNNKDVKYHTITIGKKPDEVYAFLRAIENLPRVIKNTVQIQKITDTESHWKVFFDANTTAEWEVHITEEKPEKILCWESLKDGEVQSVGSLFLQKAPGGRGTILQLSMAYRNSGNKIFEILKSLSGDDVDTMMKKHLRRLKCLMETGEIATIEGQSSGREVNTAPALTPESKPKRRLHTAVLH